MYVYTHYHPEKVNFYLKSRKILAVFSLPINHTVDHGLYAGHDRDCFAQELSNPERVLASNKITRMRSINSY